nr:hypothetical protein [Polymorphobacter sp.]
MSTDLAGLLVKWLTHDFASPIATAMTASELLSNTPDAEINELVQDATRRLAARLRLIRAALAPGDAPIGGPALEKLIREGIDGTPLTWAHAPSDTDGSLAAVIAGTALLLADLRRGQMLTITATGIHWATAAPLPESVAQSLTGAPANDSRSAVAALLAAAAARAGLVLTATADGIAWA